MNERDFIVVVGNQGHGKSVWAKLYAAEKRRLLLFDPLTSYAGVDFETDPKEWVEPVVKGERAEFRYGTCLPWELEMYGNTAYSAGDCTLLIEECSLIFKRGEELHDWAKPIIFMGRTQRVSIVLIAQRASKIPLDIRSQASRIVTFRQTEPADVDALIERFGEAGEAIPELPPLECLDWNGSETARYAIRPA